jgi:Flp pilus assembly pilin Flp
LLTSGRPSPKLSLPEIRLSRITADAGRLQVDVGKRDAMVDILRSAWLDDKGQDIAEYAVMLAVILVLVVGTIRLIGSNANNVFSSAASSIQ